MAGDNAGTRHLPRGAGACPLCRTGRSCNYAAAMTADAAFGLMLGILAHRVGWPLPHGGSQSIADDLAAFFTELGGEIVTNHKVKSLARLPPARAVLLDVTPRQLLTIAGEQLPAGYRRQGMRI